MTDPNPDRLTYRPAELARALGVEKSTVYRWMESGVVPSVKIEGVRLIRAEDVRALLARHLGG